MKSCFILFLFCNVLIYCSLVIFFILNYTCSIFKMHLGAFELISERRRWRGRERRGGRGGMGECCHDNCHNNHPNDWCAAPFLHVWTLSLSLFFSFFFSLSLSVLNHVPCFSVSVPLKQETQTHKCSLKSWWDKERWIVLTNYWTQFRLVYSNE